MLIGQDNHDKNISPLLYKILKSKYIYCYRNIMPIKPFLTNDVPSILYTGSLFYRESSHKLLIGFRLDI